MQGSPSPSQPFSPAVPLCLFCSCSSGFLAIPSTCWTCFCLRALLFLSLQPGMFFLVDFHYLTLLPCSGLYSSSKPSHCRLLWPPNWKLQPLYTLSPCPEMSCPPFLFDFSSWRFLSSSLYKVLILFLVSASTWWNANSTRAGVSVLCSLLCPKHIE